MLIWRRLSDPRIRLNSRKWDIAVVLMLWCQLALGLLTVPLSASHMDGVLFETLTSYVKGIVTLDVSVAALMIDVPLTYKLHILLGFSLFLISPFTRMIHIWSGAGTLAYLVRPYPDRAHPQEDHQASRRGHDRLGQRHGGGIGGCFRRTGRSA